MDFDDYQKQAAKYDLFEKVDSLKDVAFFEKVLGLAGEAGETADKIKKLLRDKDGAATPEDKIAVAKELGDTLWYIAAISRYLNIPLSEIASGNIEKLESRLKRNKLHGAGDER